MAKAKPSCGWCGASGHNIKTCRAKKEGKLALETANRLYRKRTLALLEKTGLVPGALLLAPNMEYPVFVRAICWDDIAVRTQRDSAMRHRGARKPHPEWRRSTDVAFEVTTGGYNETLWLSIKRKKNRFSIESEFYADGLCPAAPGWEVASPGDVGLFKASLPRDWLSGLWYGAYYHKNY